MDNTWGSYGNSKRPGFRSEVADGIRRYFRTFVLRCAFFVVISKKRLIMLGFSLLVS